MSGADLYGHFSVSQTGDLRASGLGKIAGNRWMKFFRGSVYQNLSVKNQGCSVDFHGGHEGHGLLWHALGSVVIRERSSASDMDLN